MFSDVSGNNKNEPTQRVTVYGSQRLNVSTNKRVYDITNDYTDSKVNWKSSVYALLCGSLMVVRFVI
ncbi:unnamed protein product [Schistosoma curassoni]|nr:unnamed protein product [Schistosoma curassoni]